MNIDGNKTCAPEEGYSNVELTIQSLNETSQNNVSIILKFDEKFFLRSFMFNYTYVQFQVSIHEGQSSVQSVIKQQSSNNLSISSISNASDHSEIPNQQPACLTGKIMLLIFIKCQSDIISSSDIIEFKK